MNCILNPIIDIAEKNGMLILGYGAQPLSRPSEDLIMAKPRYPEIMSRFKNGAGIWFAVIAALHVHAEVTRGELIDALNVLNSLSPAAIALCGNSSVTCGEKNGYSDYRGIVWNNAIFKEYTRRNANRTGVAKRFSDTDKYWEWFANMTPILTKRDNSYYAFRDVKSMRGFLRKGCATVVNLDTGEMISITPEPIDIDVLRGTIWPESRGTRVGTVEWRSPANQPDQRSTMAVGALELGVISNLDEAVRMVSGYNYKDIVKARESAIKDGMKAEIKEEPIINMINRMLNISEKGLENIGENPAYLAPLFERTAQRINPADEILRVFERKGMDGLLNHAALARTE
jgi:gamma-glutamylcysteine synthetase